MPFVLYRILGNDLPPRHRGGQSLANLRFLLENEPPLAGCEKRFVVNRIVDREVEEQLLGLLSEHRAEVLHLPFEPEEYRSIGWRVADFPRPGILYGKQHHRLPQVIRARAVDHAYHDKNRYVMNNNGARNAALEDGRPRATWVLPFDGNCYFTTAAWEEFRATVLGEPRLRYVLVPMARINDNRELLQPATQPEPREEPQIAFRADAAETFDENRRYGRRPKVALLRRLGVPGPWDTWGSEEWESPWPPPAPEAGLYHEAGWVARLASGEPKLEADERGRMLSRMTAIKRCLAGVDEQVLRRSFDARSPLMRSEAILEQQRAAATADVEVRGALMPLCDAEFPHHEPLAATGRFTTAARGAVTACLSGWLLGSDDHLASSAASVRALLVDPSSRITPTPTRRSPWLLKDLDHLLDVVRLLSRTGLLEERSVAEVHAWVDAHSDWLLTSKRGRRASRSLGHPGTWFEVQMAACHAFRDRAAELTELSLRVAARRHDQFHMLAPGERTTGAPKRGVLGGENLEGWVRLTSIMQRLRLSLEDPGSAGELGLSYALTHHVGGRSPHVAEVLVDPDGARPVEPHILQHLATGAPPGSAPLWWAGTVPVVANTA